MKLSIVIPVYNERDTIHEILDRVRAVKTGADEVEVIVIDDASRDGTPDRIREYAAKHGSANLKSKFCEVNRGKGAALREGIALATGEIIVIQDADLEYDPKDIAALIAPIINNDADVVYGSRFLGGPHRVLYFWHSIGNMFLTLMSNMFTNINLTDMETGYKAFRAPVLKKLNLKENRFGIEPELTAKVAKARARIFEIPISYFGRTYEEGKKITWKDGLAALRHIVRYNLFE